MKGQTVNSVQHLGMVSDLARQLSGRGIEVYSHTYDCLAFGSWQIVVGTRKQRLRLAWDGKESLLEAASCAFADSQSTADWKHSESRTIEGDAELFVDACTEIILRHCAA